MHISVTDEGIGILKSEISKIFEPFFLTSDFRSRMLNRQSHRLSLNLCKHISEALGGELKVMSVYGQGSTFAFSMRIEQLEINKYDNTSDVSLSSKTSKISQTNKKKLLQLFVE